MKSNYIALFAFLYGMFFLQNSNAQVSQVEKDALMAFYNATDGPNWADNTNWGTDEPVNTWFGITTGNYNGQEKVRFLRIFTNNLQGEVGSLLTPLTGLEQIGLGNNALTGSFIFGSEFLTTVNISNTFISNAIVTQVSNQRSSFTNAFPMRNTPNLTCFQIPQESFPTILQSQKGLFDLGDIYSTNCSAEVQFAISDRIALDALDRENIVASTNSNFTYQDFYTSTNPFIQTEEIAGERRVVSITLRNNKLSGDLVSEIGNLTELKNLRLDTNALTNIPSSLNNLTKLETLVIYQNPSLGNLPTDLSGLANLRILNMYSCGMEELPVSPDPTNPSSGIGALIDLEFLDFSNNRITLLPDEIDNLTNLTILRASPNPFPSIPNGIGNLTKLTELNFSGSEITNVPAGIGNLTALTELYLDNNNIQVVADNSLGNLTNLTVLTLNNNKLTNLTEDFGNIGSSLLVLELKNNQLESLPIDIGNLTGLTTLTLEQNKLQSLPSSIGSINQIQELDVTSSELASIPATIGNMSALRILKLTDNQLTSLPEEIGNLSNLRELLINQQRTGSVQTLTALPDEIGNLSNLRELNGNSSGLESLPATINDLTNLQRVSLSSNEIAGEVDLSSLTKLEQLNLAINSIQLLKLGVGPGAFSNSFNLFRITDNPFLTCVEVPTNTISVWDNSSLRQSSVDNGVLFTDVCGANNIPQSERTALIAIYTELQGTPSGWQNWDTDPNSLSNVGSWAGITVDYIDDVKHVVEFNLQEINRGSSARGIPLPAEISELTQLKKLLNAGFNSNAYIFTSLPESIGSLSNLKELNIAANQLEGLPEALGDLSSLELLRLLNASLITELPTSFTDLASLKEFEITSSQIQTLPEDFGSLSTLEILEFDSNALTSLPNSIGNLTNLKSLSVVGQRKFQSNERTLTTIPASLNNISGLEEIEFNQNAIAGSIDESGQINPKIDLSGLTSINKLIFRDNKLAGIKLGVSASRFNPNGSSLGARFDLALNPDLSCVEVPTNVLQTYQTGRFSSVIDDGVIFSDDCPINNLPQSERLALIAIYNALGGDDQWRNWNPDPNSNGNVGSWAGVDTEFIDGIQRVVKLEMYGDFRSPGVFGQVPTELGDLPELTSLIFNARGTGLTSIPESIGNLQKLITLHITGHPDLMELPNAVGTLGEVQTMTLSSNGFTQLPNTLEGLAKLERITISSNKLISLPSSFGSLGSLISAEFGTGEIISLPNAIGNLSLIESLNFNSNKIVSLPEEIGMLNTLTSLNLNFNLLETLPETIGNLNNLNDLQLRSNKIKIIPAAFLNLNSLEVLYATNNEIEGSVDLSGSQSLRRLELRQNKITNILLSVPPSNFSGASSPFSNALNPFLTCIEVPTQFLSDWENSSLIGSGIGTDSGVIVSDNCSPTFVPQAERQALIDFYLATGGGDKWVGTFWDTDPNGQTNVGSWAGVTTSIIDGVKHVTRLNFNSQQIDGAIPSSIEDLTELQNANFSTGIKGLPDSFGNLKNLEILTISNGSFTELPENFGNLSSLVRLVLTNNGLQSLPDSFGSLKSVTDITITGNNLIKLPISLGNLSILERLNLRSNRISEIPESLGDLNSLINLDLSSNLLKALPSSINNLNSLLNLQLEENRLEGFLDLSGLTLITDLYLTGNQQITGLKLNVSVTSFGPNGRNLRLSTNANKSFTCLEVPSDELLSWQLEFTQLPDGAAITDNCGSNEQIDRGALVALYNSTQGFNWINNTNWLSDEPISTWFGVTVDGDGRLSELVLPNNRLRGFIPLQYESTSNLTVFNVSENMMSGSVPDFEAAGATPAIDVSTNQYSYEELDLSQAENNLSNFTYLPQDYPQTTFNTAPAANTDVTLNVDDVLRFDRSFIAPNNVYQWRKNGVNIPGENASFITITNNQVDDAGEYTCRITNSVLTNLDFVTEVINLITRDEEAPVIKVKDITLALNQSGQISGVDASAFDDGTTDNAGSKDLVFSIDRNFFQCSDAGQTFEVVVTVRDKASNSSTANANLTIIDDQIPTATFSDTTLSLESNGIITLNQGSVVTSTRDNCNVQTIEFNKTQFTCEDVGENQVVVTITDSNGNELVETVTVTIEDNTAPTFSLAAPTVDLDENGQAIINAAMVTDNVNDNCEIESIVLSKDAFDCSDLGNNNVLVTITDKSGNSVQNNASVFVQDKISPLLTSVPDDFIATVEEGEQYSVLDYSTVIGVSDNCTSVPSFTQSPAPGTLLNIGEQVTVTISSTDVSGNLTQESFVITVDETLNSASNEFEVGLKLYPIPVMDQLFFESIYSIDQVLIFDINGRQIIDVQDPVELIDVSQLANGIYITKFISGDKIISKRITKNDR